MIYSRPCLLEKIIFHWILNLNITKFESVNVAWQRLTKKKNINFSSSYFSKFLGTVTSYREMSSLNTTIKSKLVTWKELNVNDIDMIINSRTPEEIIK